ncbi:MAG: DUF1858 domain-containing protein [Prolixibacteraceae bacterium]|nr:DUF1858 domain-containing protein [Prolixibacteraceae bacterium]
MEPLVITPKTKIFDLLEAYPQLEDLLIEAAPQFKKLRNPMLRKTIARITTIAQAAVVGGLHVETLVNQLRNAVGQNQELIENETMKYTTQKPTWFAIEAVVHTIDAREMLNAGEHPVHEVLGAIQKLNEGELLKVIFPFVPAPLIDKTIGLEHQHWMVQVKGDEVVIYFSKD